MDFVKDISLVGVGIAGIAIMFKFLLDAFARHLERLEQTWVTVSGRLSDKIDNVEAKLDQHTVAEEGKFESIFKILGERHHGTIR